MTRGHLFGGCFALRTQFRALMRKCIEIRKDVKRKGRKRLDVRHLFEEEAYEAAIIDYLRETGIGYTVSPEVSTPSFQEAEGWVGDFPFAFRTSGGQ